MKDIESYSDDDLIEEVASRGYQISGEQLDYVDSVLLDEILEVFYRSDCFLRQKIRDKIIINVLNNSDR